MIIYGIHTCQNAFAKRPNDILKIYVVKSKRIFSWLATADAKKIVYIDEQEFEKILPKKSVHQGVAIEIEDLKYCDITDLISAPKNSVIAILDSVTDPQNLGAIIRSAAAFGISGIVVPEKSSCKATSSAIKAASGGMEHVSIFIVKNLAQAIEKIQSYGFWVFSFCEEGAKFLHETSLTGKICLVFGAEGTGIHKLVREKSDFIIKIPTSENFKTLNVSASAAIAFYETAKQNNFKLS